MEGFNTKSSTIFYIMKKELMRLLYDAWCSGNSGIEPDIKRIEKEAEAFLLKIKNSI